MRSWFAGKKKSLMLFGVENLSEVRHFLNDFKFFEHLALINSLGLSVSTVSLLGIHLSVA
ncbi:hypothetical protein DRP07_09360 [Archaeoglobales archaeon]|nr:MAG: hypothetical protein DRP07_09360 [Archaeoglobales archaeon]